MEAVADSEQQSYSLAAAAKSREFSWLFIVEIAIAQPNFHKQKFQLFSTFSALQNYVNVNLTYKFQCYKFSSLMEYNNQHQQENYMRKISSLAPNFKTAQFANF